MTDMVSGRRQPGALCGSLWPVPGGRGNYLKGLKTMLVLADRKPEVEAFVDALIKKFPNVTSPKTARGYMHVMCDLGMASIRRGELEVTPEGYKFIETSDPYLVREALATRIGGVRELCAELAERPDRIGLVLPRMQEKGFNWQTQSQLRYRLQWLQEVGVIHKQGKARAVYSVVSPLEPTTKSKRRRRVSS